MKKLEHQVASMKKKVATFEKGDGQSKLSGSNTCPEITFDNLNELNKMKQEYCKGYERIDLANNDVLNFAFVYIEKDELSNAEVVKLMTSGRYHIEDECPSKMFAAKNISIQKFDDDYFFVVQLDTTSEDGYLKKELPMCGLTPNAEDKQYIPRTKISVKVYEDEAKCCEGVKDYNVCEKKECKPEDVPPVEHSHTKSQLEYIYDVKGTTYETKGRHKTNRRRRRLLCRGCSSS